MLTDQRDLIIGLAQLRNEPKGVSFKDKIIIDRCLKELRKRIYPQEKLNEFKTVYDELMREFERQKVAQK